MSIEPLVADVNQHLERVAIRVRGKKLSFRGTFPPKPGDGRVPKHYELASGCSATPAGLKLAKAKAQEIDSLLVRERFDWELFLKPKSKPAQTVGDWIQKFEEDHWDKVPQEPSKLNSYHKDYRLKFNHLPADKPLSLDLLKQVILERTQPGTRSRKGYAMAYRRLAEFAGLPDTSDIGALERGYSSKSVAPRDLPSDEEIAEARSKMRTPGWLWVYDVLAIYGLRPHEVFRLSTDRINESPALVEVLEGKTGRRLVFPMTADIWEFGAKVVQLPAVQVEGKNNNQLGMKISQEFREAGVGFPPYNLRHAYARRGYEQGFPPEFLARSMGHSYDVHTKVYKAWLGEDSDLKIYKAVMAKTAKFSAAPEG